MKKLDKLLIKGFIGPFIVTFMIATFVLLMQFLWLYVDDLAGKGLGILIVFELLGYKCVGLIPMAMPLAILISSVMVFGNMGERYELSSFKSGGVSLIRVMAPIIFMGVLAGFFSYFSANYLIPVSNLKFGSRMYDIQHQKPALHLEAGVFNDDFSGFAIHIDKKLPDGHTIEDVLIYDHRDGGSGLLREIIAAEGEMYSSDDDKYFVLNLKDGNQYVEQKSSRSSSKNKGQSYPFIRTKFKSWTKLFDLSEFSLGESDTDVFKKHHKMLNISQLRMAVDSISVTLNKKKINLSNHFSNYITALEKDSTYINVVGLPGNRYDKEDEVPDDIKKLYQAAEGGRKPSNAKDAEVKGIVIPGNAKSKGKEAEVKKITIPGNEKKGKQVAPKKSKPKKVAPKPESIKKAKAKEKASVNKSRKKTGPKPVKQNLDSLEVIESIISTFAEKERKRIFSKSKSTIRSVKGQAVSAVRTLGDIRETRVKYIFDLHTKYSMAMVCFIFVFIGAPMGAIVRKGGFGYPILISIVFFILFIVLTIFCKKIAESFVIDPMLAAWVPGIVLFPIGLFLTLKAMNDSKLLNPDRLVNYLKKVFSKKTTTA
jgi:lipopolysaccharide export system permease protein